MKGNAQIKRTTLGYEDHGILTCWLYLEQSGSGQGFGGYRLYAPKGNSIYTDMWVKRILEVVGVREWESLPGKYVRVEGEEFGKIEGIGNILEDKWFYPAKELKEKEENDES